jgi:hypothetical protein
MFPQFYPEHIIFALFHHSLGVVTLISMLIASWASPGRVNLSSNKNINQDSQRCDDALTNQEENKSQKFSVEIGNYLIKSVNFQ